MPQRPKRKEKASVTLSPNTIKEVERLRKDKKVDKSFSAMVDILLDMAVPAYRKQKGLPA